MNSIAPSNRSWQFVFLVVGVVAAVVLGMFASQLAEDLKPEIGKSKRRSGLVQPEVVQAAQPGQAVAALPPPGGGFTPQVRLGHTVGDQWEPAIATDRFNHVYMLYPQYYGVPGCSDCYSPTMILQISADNGTTWNPPTIIYPAGQTTGQWDAQVVVDPVDGRTVYAAWLQNGKSDIAVGKSTDFGATWSVVIVDSTNAGTDKPILVARGSDVYVAYNHAQKEYVSSSHDGGVTWTQTEIKSPAKLGWSLAAGAAIDNGGNVYFSWAGYTRNGGATGSVHLYVSKSSNGGQTWTTKQIDVSGAPPSCPEYTCGWAYLGAQVVMTSDSAGTLYALWNASSLDKGPNRVYFAKSTDGGATWTPKVDVSSAANGTHHNFPAIAATGNGDVRISWMDNRAGNWWNTYYRSSSNGGGSWSVEVDVSSYVSGFTYIDPVGFRFPFGDYYELDIDPAGNAHIIMGEGYSYDSPGSIWYTRGK